MYYRHGATPRPLYRRTQSARETYHPAIADLSEQTLRVSNGYNDDDGYICKISSLDRAGSHDFLNGELSYRQSDLVYSNKYYDPFNDDAQRRQSTPTTTRLPRMCDENVYRQRIVMSAHNRYKLGSLYKRPRSVDNTHFSYPKSPRALQNGYMTPSDIENNNYQYPPSLLVTNCNSTQETPSLERRKSLARPQSKDVSRSGTLLADGSEQQKNGFHQHLVNKHPIIKQRLSHWLTSGFKIQSLRSKVIQRKVTTKNGPHDVGTRRKLSEHKLVEDFKKIRLNRLQNDSSMDNDHVTVCDNNLTSSLHITNLNRVTTSNGHVNNIEMCGE